MGKQLSELTDALISFIEQQKIFFVGTADEGRVNCSPKGMDAFKVINSRRVIWLNATGSGNETSAHIQHNPRMTIMFCAFEGAPLTLRLYGQARVIHKQDANWDELYALFSPLAGARQIFDLSIDLVQTSCGMATPYFAYQGEREDLSNWATAKGDSGLAEYWAQKNTVSLDGVETHIVEKNIDGRNNA
jgi:hypothetical protein